MKEPNDALKRARRAIDGFPGVVGIGDWEWLEGQSRWTLNLRLSHGMPPTKHVPAETNWRVLAQEDYPSGDVQFYPALEGGIEATFPHQRFNSSNTLPGMRSGHICLTRPQQSLGRSVDASEPSDPVDRFRWRIGRAIAWIQDASQDNLAPDGEYFELPDFPGIDAGGEMAAFQENEGSLSFWDAQAARSGVATIMATEHALFVHEFLDLREASLRLDEWGAIGSRQGTLAAWVLFDRVPVSDPWRPPTTLGELRSILGSSGIDLDDIILKTAARHRKVFRNGKRALLLLGFPISEKFGMKPDRIHWQALRMPTLSPENSNGFRPQNLHLRDRAVVLGDGADLKWMKSENWAESELASRGSLPEQLRSRRVVIIGAGALGSMVAELLLRGGVKRMVIVDDDYYQAGNSVRHILDLTAVGTKKAAAVATRLSLLSPHARVQAVSGKFPRLANEALEAVADAELVIDATGDDDLLKALKGFPWKNTPDLVSLSFGYAARRLFCYFTPMGLFTSEGFKMLLEPWLQVERDISAAKEFPREGTGCWSPIFPARADDVWLNASVAVKWLEQTCTSRSTGLKVFEQGLDTDGVFSVREVLKPSV